MFARVSGFIKLLPVAGLLALSCTKDSVKPSAKNAASLVSGTSLPPVYSPSFRNVTAPPGFKVVGYFPDWGGDISKIQFDKLTHIHYAFILPTPDGGLTACNEVNLKMLVAMAHKNGVKVCISIGGYNNGDQHAFEILASQSSTINKFAKSVVGFCNKYNLDGADITWEFPSTPVSARKFEALMKVLSSAIHGSGRTLSAMLGDNMDKARYISNTIFNYADYFNLMAFNAGSPHSLYTEAVSCINYWSGRKMPRKKMILGLPFYGKQPFTHYSQLVVMDTAAPYKDNVGKIYYNGVQTIKNKTWLAMQQAGGVMLWELSQDTYDNTSLLKAVNDATKGSPF